MILISGSAALGWIALLMDTPGRNMPQSGSIVKAPELFEGRLT
jgi:hypothetical protein